MSAKTERLVNLTVALLASPRPITFAELRRRMGEWQGGDHQSQRRKFERDKDELRRLGVPIETSQDPSGEAAYVIDRDRYALPDVPLTVEQMTVLAVAYQLVDGGADRVAFSKVAAGAPDPDDPQDRVPTGIRVRPDDIDAVGPLARAVVDRRVVRFTHRKPDGTTTDRVVEPTAMLSRRGRWYLRGVDRTRDARRTFRADRIVGPVEVTDEVATATAEDDPFAEELFASPDEVELTVAVRTDDGWRREHRRDRWLRATADALGAAPHEVVLAPADVRAAVVAGLEAVVAAHEDAAEVSR